MACLPGNPCYGWSPEGPTPLPPICVASNNVIYYGGNLPNTGIENNTSLTVAFQKIDAKLDPNQLATAVLTAINSSVQLKTLLCNIISGCV